MVFFALKLQKIKKFQANFFVFYFFEQPTCYLSENTWLEKMGISIFFRRVSRDGWKAVLSHPLGPSSQHTSFILKILIGQEAKSRAKSAYFSCHTCVTLHIYYGKDIKKLSSLSNYGSFLYPCYPQRSTKNLMVTGGHLLWKKFAHSRFV